jgi:hypothetical protein
MRPLCSPLKSNDKHHPMPKCTNPECPPMPHNLWIPKPNCPLFPWSHMSYLVNVLMKPHININSLGMKALMGMFLLSVNLPFLTIHLHLCKDFGSMQQIILPSVQMITRLCQWNDGLSQACYVFAFVWCFLSQVKNTFFALFVAEPLEMLTIRSIPNMQASMVLTTNQCWAIFGYVTIAWLS